MDKVLIDTDILSEFLKGKNQNVVKLASTYARLHGRFTFSSVTVFEIIKGLLEKGAPAQVVKAHAWLKSNDEVTPTADDYLTSANIKAAARKMGKIVELPDCLIAAAASRLGLILVTGNTADFQVITEAGLPLVLANWRDE